MRYQAVFATIVLALLSDLAALQAQQRTYQPSRPALSPYLYLTKPSIGPFPNYQAFVQPTRNQQQFNQYQSTEIKQLQQSQQNQQAQQYAPAQISPTGIGASHGNLSHYFSGSAQAGGPQQQRSRAPPRR